MGLSESEILRYARHIILPEVGGRGQLKLRQASVLVVGLGGVGCSAAAYLAAAGIGRLGVADPRPVDAAPASGGLLFAAAEAAAERASAAVAPLQALNPHASVAALPGWPADRSGWDAVIASAGPWQTFTASGESPCPLLLCGAAGMRGVLAWLASPGGLPALLAAGLMPEAPGSFAPVAGAIGTAAATEVLKRVLDLGQRLPGMLTYDGYTGRFTSIGD